MVKNDELLIRSVIFGEVILLVVSEEVDTT